MTLLLLYVFVAIAFSFLCSILEAVLLSVNSAHTSLLINEGKAAGKLLKQWQQDIDKPLVAILTLNTIAHTIGAAGAGAQASAVFGSVYVGVFSAILTLLILIFSEIIPKMIGARYWRQLSCFTAYTLKYMIWFLFPFIKLAEVLTSRFKSDKTLAGFSREEFAAMADLSSEEGQLEVQESHFLKSLLLLRKMRVRDAMTPRPVIFSLSETLLVEEYFHKYDQVHFSRIPVYRGDVENIIGYVFRSDLLLAKARDNGQRELSNYIHFISPVLENMPIQNVFNKLLKDRTHIMLVINEYGSLQGIITLEDVIETALGLEIVDEKDKAVDMQHEARRLWKKRAKNKGIDIGVDV
ncbi:MAG: hemolysin family protein [Litorilituus sp.]|jgi:CBS domain containing-hemolysin-like protein|nr:hemolysin family protein [Litorilituus sp.]